MAKWAIVCRTQKLGDLPVKPQWARQTQEAWFVIRLKPTSQILVHAQSNCLLLLGLMQVVIQQLPEWIAHEWTYEKELPSET